MKTQYSFRDGCITSAWNSAWVNKLLQTDIDPDIIDIRGDSALHYVAKKEI